MPGLPCLQVAGARLQLLQQQRGLGVAAAGSPRGVLGGPRGGLQLRTHGRQLALQPRLLARGRLGRLARRRRCGLRVRERVPAQTKTRG